MMKLLAYDSTRLVELKLSEPDEVKPYLNQCPVLWISVDGPQESATVARFGEIFDLHELAVEDVINARQRAKVEQYGSQLFIILRLLSLETGRPVAQQLSLFVSKNFVLTFQEKPDSGCLESVRERIRKNVGTLRQMQADYLAYAIIDGVIDGYFPVLEEFGEILENLEDDILEHLDRKTPARLHEAKRDILLIRRTVWPLREALNIMTRDCNAVISDQTHIYLRDCYDHVVRIMDLIETYREIGSDLMDLYLSMVSNRMNEIIKVLTIITTLFIPPSFIAAIYGMAFHTEKSPWNMPELSWYFGYPFALLLMAVVAGLLALFLWRKGWIGT